MQHQLTAPLMSNNNNSKVLPKPLLNSHRIVPRRRIPTSTRTLPINTTPTNRPLQPQKHNPLHLHTSTIPITPLHTKRLPIKAKLHQRRRFLHNADPVIEIKLSGCFSVRADRDDDLEVLLAELGGCHCALN